MTPPKPGDRVTTVKTYVSVHTSSDEAMDAVERGGPGWGVEQWGPEYHVFRTDRIESHADAVDAVYAFGPCEQGPNA